MLANDDKMKRTNSTPISLTRHPFAIIFILIDWKILPETVYDPKYHPTRYRLFFPRLPLIASNHIDQHNFENNNNGAKKKPLI